MLVIREEEEEDLCVFVNIFLLVVDLDEELELLLLYVLFKWYFVESLLDLFLRGIYVNLVEY